VCVYLSTVMYSGEVHVCVCVPLYCNVQWRGACVCVYLSTVMYKQYVWRHARALVEALASSAETVDGHTIILYIYIYIYNVPPASFWICPPPLTASGSWWVYAISRISRDMSKRYLLH
jgi:hypothetical protein